MIFGEGEGCMKESEKSVGGIGYFGRKIEYQIQNIYIYIYIIGGGLGGLMLMSDWLADG